MSLQNLCVYMESVGRVGLGGSFTAQGGCQGGRPGGCLGGCACRRREICLAVALICDPDAE